MKTPGLVGLLTPRTVAKIERLPAQERRMYLQELRGSFEYRRNHLNVAARDLAQEWTEQQTEHMDRVISALTLYLER